MRQSIQAWKQQTRELRVQVYAVYLACKHPQTPLHAKLFAGLVVAYAFSPIDLVPDFIPVLGYLDDLILVPLGIAIALRLIPADVLAECRKKSQEMLQEGKPVNKAAAIVIILFWLLLAILAIRLVLALAAD